MFEGMGAGTALVEDVDSAAGVITEAVRASYDHLGPDALAHLLTTVVAPLRVAMVTDGYMALKRSDDWADGVAGIFVTLSRSE